MNAPATIDPLLKLAAQIASGDYSGLPAVDHQTYDRAEWRAAAVYALDGDTSDLALMYRRELALDAHHNACRVFERVTGRDWDNSPELFDPAAWADQNFARPAESYIPQVSA